MDIQRGGMTRCMGREDDTPLTCDCGQTEQKYLSSKPCRLASYLYVYLEGVMSSGRGRLAVGGKDRQIHLKARLQGPPAAAKSTYIYIHHLLSMA